MSNIADILLDSFLDSLKVLGFAFIIFFIFSFFEDKIIRLFNKKSRISPLIGASLGLIPECGVSVLASDLYTSRLITTGTIFAVFFASSDEALPLLISNFDKAIYALPLLFIKIIFGFLFGFLIDLIYHKNDYKEIKNNDYFRSEDKINNEHENESFFMSHFMHPFLHSIKIFVYVFIISFLFGLLLYFIGEDNVIKFMSENIYLSPLFASIIGLIPNCSSSILITNVFIKGGIPFAALTSGLSVNSGVGILYLFKSKNDIKNKLFILSSLFLTSNLVGYITLFIMKLF